MLLLTKPLAIIKRRWEIQMSDLTEVIWYKNPKSLSEIYQQTGMVFAFATAPKKGELASACHEWVKCRDFLHDAVRSQITGTPCAIYGFQFNPSTNPNVDLRKMRMLVSKNGLKVEDLPAFRNKMIAGLALINHFEKQAKVSLTKMEEINPKNSGKKAVYLFTGPMMWVRSPFLVSMFTFLIRLGDKELEFKNIAELKKGLEALAKKSSEGKISDNDCSYLQKMWNKLHTIIKNRAKLFTVEQGVHNIYHGKYSISQFHNYCGILSLSQGNTPDKKLNELVKEVTK